MTITIKKVVLGITVAYIFALILSWITGVAFFASIPLSVGSVFLIMCLLFLSFAPDW
ncbi:MAG: hypothetical protein WC761_06760 [Candidatus Paceibacterota bacterium]|jgi:hypothetical protein